jgi:endonuclease/exonuclease/phosphatase family metal-dependent hydrolase
MKKPLTIVSLNLWRFHDWEKRFPAIVTLLKELNPDIILTQETQLDIVHNSRNQIEILNEALAYPHAHFALADVKTTRKGVPLPHPVDHGHGILSRFPFTPEIIKLTKAADDKEQRILLRCEVVLESRTQIVTNVHFSNSDAWAEAHFREAMPFLKQSIVAGDFNIRDLSKYRDVYAESHRSSADEFNYVSYPEDGVSYDYVLIPKEYTFTSFECRAEYVSDHRMLISNISIL